MVTIKTVAATTATDHDHGPAFLPAVRNQPRRRFFSCLACPLTRPERWRARYQYQAIEFKETSHRADGVFLPKEPGLPLYFLEVQFYPLPSVFADLLAKVYTYLKQHEPGQRFCGVVLFASRSL